MKSIRSFSFFLLVLIGLIAFTACNPIVKPELLPVLTTTEVNAITQTTATSGGNITSDAGSSITARGVCWSTNTNPTIADSKTTDGGGIGSFTSSITGLTAGTTYYVRAYATTSTGTGYGGAFQITTIVATPTVTDADGNVYHTITIGTQVWMVENLKTTKYNDGTAIPLVTDNTAWANLITPCYCWYNNDATTYKNTYGALYNWYAVNTAKLAPTGWHVPSNAELLILENFLIANGFNFDGTTNDNKLAKSLATNNWKSSTVTGTIGNNDYTAYVNKTNFNALPTAYLNYDGVYTIDDKSDANWWLSTNYDSSTACMWSLDYNSISLNPFNYWKKSGLSIRCVKD